MLVTMATRCPTKSCLWMVMVKLDAQRKDGLVEYSSRWESRQHDLRQTTGSKPIECQLIYWSLLWQPDVRWIYLLSSSHATSIKGPRLSWAMRCPTKSLLYRTPVVMGSDTGTVFVHVGCHADPMFNRSTILLITTGHLGNPMSNKSLSFL